MADSTQRQLMATRAFLKEFLRTDPFRRYGAHAVGVGRKVIAGSAKASREKDRTVPGRAEPKRDRPCAPGVCDPQRTQGLRAPAPQGEHTLVSLDGPGVFLAAEISKQGGTNDITFVDLEIDGRNVVNLSYAAAENLGLTQHNPFGLVLLKAGQIETMTIGFPTPLAFASSLELRVTVKEPDVVQILANVVHGG
jgi:hypothetical protein